MRLDTLPSVFDVTHLDAFYYRLAWLLAPLAAFFALGSLFWWVRRRHHTPIIGHTAFVRMINEANGWHDLATKIVRTLRADPNLAQKTLSFSASPETSGLAEEALYKLPTPPHKQMDWLGEWLDQKLEALSNSGTQAETGLSTLLYASQTGNGEGLALDMASLIEQAGFRKFRVVNMADYDPAHLIYERQVFILSSTHGDGEPPLPAHRLYAYLHGPDAPVLAPLQYAVLGLGDSGYRQFCKAGKDFDAILEKLGAERVLPRVDADADFDAAASEWLDQVMALYRQSTGDAGLNPDLCFTNSRTTASPEGPLPFGKNNPYPARMLANRPLNGPASSKDTRHIEIDLEDSGLVYEAGDALGVIPRNNPRYVEQLLEVLGVDGYSEVSLGQDTLTVREAFFSRLDITALSRPLVEKFAEIADNPALHELLAGGESPFQHYVYGRHILDMLQDFPSSAYRLEDFVGILRRLPPRLYSIASSMKAVGQQVHLTVGTVRYHAHGRDREGVCSTFLGDRITERERLGIFVQANPHFRLPRAGDTPVIMVGPGTGIAPFRSFIQEREATGATGKNWLFFGDQRRDCDYLYADEWNERHRRSILTRLDLAFSRDQTDKVYVQTRMQEQAGELYHWLESGACFYVCGDASRMAHDVHQTLLTIVSEQSGKSLEQAGEYLRGLQDAGRYQRDVY